MTLPHPYVHVLPLDPDGASGYDFLMFQFFNMQNDPRLAGYYQRVQRQPSWVLKLSVLVAVAIVVVPLVVLTLAAVLAGAIVFFIGSVFASFFRLFRRDSPEAARHNVRVIHRE